MDMMLMQLEKLAKMMGHDDFKATWGWLARLCKRADMKGKKLHGEGASADVEARDTWLKDTNLNLYADYSEPLAGYFYIVNCSFRSGPA